MKRDVRQALYTDDVLGLSVRPNTLVGVGTGGFVAALRTREFEFATSAEKVKAFRTWFDQQVQGGMLQGSWSNEYVESAYKKGLERAYVDSNKAGVIKDYTGTRQDFLRSSFFAPETTSKLQLLFTRTFNELRGVSEAMGQQLSRTLTQGLADGWNPLRIATEVNKNVFEGKNLARARMISRTEVIRAHAEGQLDSFERLGVEEVGAEVEFSTAQDELVCPECSALDGQIMPIDEARGIIPVHPNCRCTWLPAPLAKKQALEGKSVTAPKPVTAPEPVTAPKPVTAPEPVTAPKPVSKAGTQFTTAEQYRQHLLNEVERVTKDPEAVKAYEAIKAIHDKLSRQYYKLLGKMSKEESIALGKEVIAAEKQLAAAKKAITVKVEAQRKMLAEIDNKVGSIKIYGRGVKKLKTYEKTTDELLSWVPKNRETVAYKYHEVFISEHRQSGTVLGEYAEQNAQIRMYQKSAQVFAHEFGHHLEHTLKDFYRAQTQFFRQRTVNDHTVNLFGNVYGKRDKWSRYNVYAGRIYQDHTAPEVASVGIEYIWKNPYSAAKKDPEWFNFIISQLKGIPTE